MENRKDLEFIIRVYYENTDESIRSFTSINTFKILHELFRFIDYNADKAIMNTQRRKEIIKKCNISKTSHYKAIDELSKFNVLYKDGDIYTINPKMFWKGDEEAREKLLESEYNTNE